jgi:hypothetical protein
LISPAKLGGAALPVRSFVFFFLLVLTLTLTLFRLSRLAVLPTLTGFAVLVKLSGLITVLSRLAALVPGLSTLLFVFLHVVCHKMVLPLERATGRTLSI